MDGWRYEQTYDSFQIIAASVKKRRLNVCRSCIDAAVFLAWANIHEYLPDVWSEKHLTIRFIQTLNKRILPTYITESVVRKTAAICQDV